MTKRQQVPEGDVEPVDVNPGYAAFQIARALVTVEEHDDAATRARARDRVSKWKTVLGNMLTGAVKYGSRKPVVGVPEWATLEVVTGGFATGELLAAGPLQEHEERLLKVLAGVPEHEHRRALNAHFLTDSGLEQLQHLLSTGEYDVGVPEEGALMVIAWLVQTGYAEDARGLLDKLAPHFSRLRFYPIPLERARRFGLRMHLQDVGTTLADIKRIRPNKRILAQKEAIEIWAPLYDRVVTLFLETVKSDWPCQIYPEDWPVRALALLGEYAELRKEHTYCGKLARANGHSAQLVAFLGKCARKPDELTGREVGRIRLILNRYIAKRGTPDSRTCIEARHRQAAAVSAPTFHTIAKIVASRLEKYAKNTGLDDVSHLQAVVNDEEAAISGVPQGTAIPTSIQRKVERCLNETADVLVERGLITSGETLARVLPQMISEIQATDIVDPELRHLYASIYRAFRRRRSLLLLNLEKQVQFEELPWIAVIERFRNDALSNRELARTVLEEVAVLTLTAFPHSILPNKLLQELRALVRSAGLDIPLVDELAADIFMGKFSSKYVESAMIAADLLDGSLYATYYGIDFEEIRRIKLAKATTNRSWFRHGSFARLCASRAGVKLGTWNPATNGMIIEQQQILTTQNLAALIVGLDLSDTLRSQFGDMSRQCFRWVCKRQQMKVHSRHAQLIMLKNTAYAWRQMIFFLTLLPKSDIVDFLKWAKGHLGAQSEAFRDRFEPVFNGLLLATSGASLDHSSVWSYEARRFLGWSKTQHWLLFDEGGEGQASMGYQKFS